MAGGMCYLEERGFQATHKSIGDSKASSDTGNPAQHGWGLTKTISGGPSLTCRPLHQRISSPAEIVYVFMTLERGLVTLAAFVSSPASSVSFSRLRSLVSWPLPSRRSVSVEGKSLYNHMGVVTFGSWSQGSMFVWAFGATVFHGGSIGGRGLFTS